MSKTSQRGIIMITVLMLMPICIILGAIMLKDIITEKNFVQYERERGAAFYMAETGVNVAYYSFSGSTFTEYTHNRPNNDPDQDHAGNVVSVNPLVVSPLITSRTPFTRATSGQWLGWYEYTWTPGCGYDSLTHTGQKEAIHFRVTRTYDGSIAAAAGTRPTAWEIVSIAQLGEVTKTHRLTGDLQGLTDFTIFDAGDCNEFIRGANQNISGKVHSNGDMYLKPSGTTLTINTQTADGEAGFTTAGKFWYGKDATGRTNMGTVKLSNKAPVNITWPTNLDSFTSNWSAQATSIWKGTVADQSLGAGVKGVPPTKSFDPDGFYAVTAKSGGLAIRTENGKLMVKNDAIGTGSLAGAITQKSFYNHAEKRMVTAVQVDVSKLTPADYANGLIYSEKPIILVNAQKLPHKTSIISQSGVYTMGDFNKECATANDLKIRTDKTNPKYDPNYTTKVSAAIMTKDRIWHLSKNAVLPANSSTGFKLAGNDPEEYTGDNTFVNRETSNGTNNVIEVNAMLVDGAPLYDETWNRTVDKDGKIVPKWGPTKADPNAQAASWDDYLENFGSSRVVKKRGSIIHLQNGKLPTSSTLFNASAGTGTPDGEVAWYRQIAYEAPFRDYGYDLKLKTDPPPFAPMAANRALWVRH